MGAVQALQDPGLGAMVQLPRGECGGLVDLLGGEGLSGEGFAPASRVPTATALLEVEEIFL
jgi:hypothetical protein